MTNLMSREIRLASRPTGIPTAANFTLERTKLEPLEDQQVLVRNIFMSVDPYMRGRMNAGKSYVPPFELGKALNGGAVGEVVESRAKEFKPGDAVTSNYGWREYFIAVAERTASGQPRNSASLGLPWRPRHDGHDCMGRAQFGGSQSRRRHFHFRSRRRRWQCGWATGEMRGCLVIGSAGSAEKVRFLREECGFDIAFNYKVRSRARTIESGGPDGIDVYFDNVGGETLEAALRFCACMGESSPVAAFPATTKRSRGPGLPIYST